jgi:hypothetical protein
VGTDYFDGKGHGAGHLFLTEPGVHSPTSTHTPFSLVIPIIYYQTILMKSLIAAICLTIGVLLGSEGVTDAGQFR